MTLQPALQPIVCCIGNPVAGNPTQFVMSRAAKDCGLDWRFFTSQVAEESFDAAVRGVQALGMQGLVVLEPFQSLIIPKLDTVTQSALRLQRVTVARSDGNSWLGDNLFPTAIWQAIDNAAPKQLDAPILPEKREFASDSVSDVEVPAKIARTLFVGSESLFDSLVMSRPRLECEMERWIPGTSLSTDEKFDSEGAAAWSAVVFERVPDLATSKALLGLSWGDSPRIACLDASFSSEGRKAREQFLNRGFLAIEPVEWMVCEAMANFAFWTGVTPPVDGIRESLEEYLQW
ncbi:shikimate 5-dehydrogenase [Pirellula sp. SH-Sr6A]|uniref:hypothetical protein n=1 Tax=Pirellula sp. SH-Sr6A TaxID=1632865 RepID=UPI00078E6ABA|nr:hypothetical protein [Pirellula sp. SH-Sr6A]AMV32763.1 shikimate 5-dehydrogenase [Pirellula sp. SH-Sr6A]